MNVLPRLNAWFSAVLLFFLTVFIVIIADEILDATGNYFIYLLIPIPTLAIGLYFFYALMPQTQPYLTRIQRPFNPILISVLETIISIGILIISTLCALAFYTPFIAGSSLIKINSGGFLVAFFVWLVVASYLYEINYSLQEKFVDTIRKQSKVNSKRI